MDELLIIGTGFDSEKDKKSVKFELNLPWQFTNISEQRRSTLVHDAPAADRDPELKQDVDSGIRAIVVWRCFSWN